jgi:hypothetical protein
MPAMLSFSCYAGRENGGVNKKLWQKVWRNENVKIVARRPMYTKAMEFKLDGVLEAKL